jgi:hypothetical protein
MVPIRVCGLSPGNESTTSPASVVDAMPNENTPIDQWRLLAQPGTSKSDNIEGDDNDCNKSLCQLNSQSLELDMDLVHIEANEGGDGDSDSCYCQSRQAIFLCARVNW